MGTGSCAARRCCKRRVLPTDFLSSGSCKFGSYLPVLSRVGEDLYFAEFYTRHAIELDWPSSLRLPDVFGPFDSTKRHWRYQLWLQGVTHVPSTAVLSVCLPRFTLFTVLIGTLVSDIYPVHVPVKEHRLSFVYSVDVAHAALAAIRAAPQSHGHAFSIAFFFSFRARVLLPTSIVDTNDIAQLEQPTLKEYLEETARIVGIVPHFQTSTISQSVTSIPIT